MYKVKVEGLGSNKGTFGWRIDAHQISSFITILLENGWETIMIEPIEDVEKE